MMPVQQYNDYQMAGLILLGFAAVITTIGMLTNRGDITSATLILAGISSFVAGVLALTLFRGDPLDADLVSMLPVQGTLNLYRFSADLGAAGRATFIRPTRGDLPKVMQYIPAEEPSALAIDSDYTFLTGEKGSGLLITPNGYPFLEYLRQQQGLVVPRDESDLFEAIREVYETGLDVAEKAVCRRDGDAITLTLSGFRLAPACAVVRQAAPQACMTIACPICSLCGCLVAEGLGGAWVIDRVRADPENGSVQTTFSPLR
jgi:hypothetical protein